ncbi:hypothetical protein COLO4_10180 [Corchorus olitorius]|uniref:Uncharacterized protein n=1 Tax=Corchorus olitorius TaxID=93759 RepID=A0A1R3K9P6_9ROSI|nr:hypothetical protein COLO4_10180 [Corchorus olitorius]
MTGAALATDASSESGKNPDSGDMGGYQELPN